MTVNFKEDLIEGAVVEFWQPKGREFVKYPDVKLIESRECRENLTLIYHDSVYSYECWLVEMEDGFVTTRKVYFLVADNWRELPEEFTDQYTYNLYYENKDNLIDKYGGKHNTH